jgi:hypothetical protein
MPHSADDLDAVRTIVKTLEGFEPKEQERILRWAREKLGLWVSSSTQDKPISTLAVDQERSSLPSSRPPTDVKSFLNVKQPTSERQLAAAVAYYYRFEAPENQRKDAITKDDLLNACRMADWDRPKKAEQTLVNAQHAGLLDKGSERGTYVINSVGENLVAMTLPEAGKARPAKRARSRIKR